MVDAGDHQIDMDKTRGYISAYRKELHAGWIVLAVLLESHEELIRVRWLKGTRAGRKAILLAAQPDLPESHRPDITAFFQKDLTDISKRCSSFACPHMNLEDLMRPKALLIFLDTGAVAHQALLPTLTSSWRHCTRHDKSSWTYAPADSPSIS